MNQRFKTATITTFTEARNVYGELVKTQDTTTTVQMFISLVNGGTYNSNSIIAANSTHVGLCNSLLDYSSIITQDGKSYSINYINTVVMPYVYFLKAVESV